MGELMIVSHSELWPDPAKIPEHLIEVNARLTEDLGALAVMNAEVFDEKQHAIMQRMTKGEGLYDIARHLFLPKEEVEDLTTEAIEKSGMRTAHGLLYLGHHSGWLPYDSPDRRRSFDRLPAVRSVVLKQMALGESREEIVGTLGVTAKTVKLHVVGLQTKLLVHNAGSIITGSYHAGLFAPASQEATP